MKEQLSGWGRYQPVDMEVLEPRSRQALASATLPPQKVIARGLGRSYGDAAQRRDGTALLATACHRIEWVDKQAGTVRADAGATIAGLIAVAVPTGFFVPVSPGTRNVTVGGAIAADIHGKNHHLDGSFGNHVLSLRLRLADDSMIECSPSLEPDIFWATVGGMGLTGVIVDADISLSPVPTSTVAVETSRLGSLDELMRVMVASDSLHDFSVAWVDLLGGGRSVLTQGSFAATSDVESHPAGPLRRPRTPVIGLPPLPPVRFVQRPLMKVFNELWFRRAPAEPTTTHESITAFFHPLDALSDWNRLYGKTGFVQWQCVVESDDTLRQICAAFGRQPAFFSVLKRFGPANPAPLSFPRAGWTLAVDVPATRAALASLDAIDALVAADGGRLYLAKDSRMSREVFEAGYPRLDEWKTVRAALDPHKRFSSDLSERLGL